MEAKVLPGGLVLLLLGLCDSEGGCRGSAKKDPTTGRYPTVLVGNHIILVFGIDGLVVRGNVDIVIGELVATKVLKQVGDAAGGEVDVGADRVFRLADGGVSFHRSRGSSAGAHHRE